MSKIEWTDETWNPIVGCSKVSPGCDNCYAERMANRLAGVAIAEHNAKMSNDITGASKFDHYVRTIENGKWTGSVAMNEDVLVKPRHWKKPRMVFVCSMGDLFHESVPFEWIDKVFAVMALCPQHTFQVLTKRSKRMLEYLTKLWPKAEDDTEVLAGLRICGEMGELSAKLKYTKDQYKALEQQLATKPVLPLPNVWLGVTAEDQQRADERIPDLLKCPAAKRFVSCEPLLGQIDLKGWGDAAYQQIPEYIPNTWAEWTWPDWVPDNEQKLIEEFWAEKNFDRSPRQWFENQRNNGGFPVMGALIGAKINSKSGWGQLCPAKSSEATITGKYLHRWNNIGVVVTEDGESIPVSSHGGPGWLSKWACKEGYRHRLHWVICGGESGPGARPMHPDWARSLRDQCNEAGVAFFFKQWGKWVPFYDRDKDDPDMQRIPAMIPNRQTRINIEGGSGFHGERVIYFLGKGKKKAGRLLDGVEHNEFPEVIK